MANSHLLLAPTLWRFVCCDFGRPKISRRGGEIMSVDMIFVDEDSTRTQGYISANRQFRFRERLSNPDFRVCDAPLSIGDNTSAVHITEILYRNITGATKGKNAIKFACSDAVPCNHIVLNNVNLEGKDGKIEANCNSAEGFGYGVVQLSRFT